MDYRGIIETAQRVQSYFAPFHDSLIEQDDDFDPERVWQYDDRLDEEDNPYGGDSVFKMKLIFQGANPKNVSGVSDKYWEVKVRADGSVMRKWGATGKKAHMKAEKKANSKAGISYAKSMAAKKKAKGYKEVKAGSSKAKSKKVYPSYGK